MRKRDDSSMTTTAQIGISVLSAPLAAIDRRSLSQAWYSALHLARDPAPPKTAATGRTAARPIPASVRSPGDAPSVRASAAPASSKALHSASARAGAALERRVARLPLTRRIERALFERTCSAARTTFAVGAGTGRVVVALHASGGTVRIVALCSPALRHTVARALDQARFALAARDIELETGILEGTTLCS
jgi:hypothetical protein